MRLNIEFKNNQQRLVYYATQRNQCFSGGFNNGKSFIFCLKCLSLLLTFPNYRLIIAREKYTDLKRTTMQTFLKMCPSELISSHNEQDGITTLVNGSLIWWIHLDNVDENTLRGIEPNSIFVDQAEETAEKVYDVLDGRVGRWDGAIVPAALLASFPNWPYKNGKPIAPSYIMLACNPDTEFHYIYRKYHPDSPERSADYFFIEGEWDRNLGSEETYDEAIKRDQEWVDKYVRGKWGSSNAAIHAVRAESILTYTPELLDEILSKGSLSRVLDHGDSAPTCCAWFAAVNGVYIAYREYYVSSKLISFHRKGITDLSGEEEYMQNFADPQIFKPTAQKIGAYKQSVRWSVADEYKDLDIDAPPLYWMPADNNEFATRNRINELLHPSIRFRHPVTKETPAPGLYFIQASNAYPQGCKEIIRQTGAQRKKALGTIDGKTIYDDARDENIVDHAYDVVRYFVAMHSVQPRQEERKPPRNSFAYFNVLIKRRQMQSPVAASTRVQ